MDDPLIAARKIELCFENLRQIEELMLLPAGVPGRTDQICALAAGGADSTPHGGIALAVGLALG